MVISKIYLWGKKLHRLLMWIMMGLGVPISISGLVLHRVIGGERLPIPIDVRLVRFWHGKLSQPFVLVFVAMSVTGLVMWGVPKLLNIRRKQK